MTAYNVVRFRTKPGLEDEFEEWFCKLRRDLALIKTGERSYCSIGEWESFEHIVAARPKMVSNLDKFRHSLEAQGESIDVTDAVSGEAIYESAPTK